MSENGNASELETDRRQDPREVLDPIKRVKILALVEMGCSRRMAAKQVGCAGSTITRTAQRDPQFGKLLAGAEGQADVRALKLLSRTAEQEKYWRVAAWILERRNPDEYGRRAPHTFTGEQVLSLLAQGMQSALATIPDEAADDFIRAFEDLLADVAYEAKLPPPQKIAAEDIEPAPVAAPTVSAQQVAAVPPPIKPHPAAPNGRMTSPAGSLNQKPAATGTAPRANGHAVASPSHPAEEKRRSCLEQFVQRTPRPELAGAGK